MVLDAYRRKKGWSYSELARQLGAAHATVARRWCLGFDDDQRLIPSVKFMERIVTLTAGEVRPDDFYLRRD